MKRSRPPRRAMLAPDTEQLIRLATGLAQSNSRLEDSYWESRLSALIDRLLKERDEAALSAALDQLYGSQDRAYDALADLTEASSETRAEHEQDLLLFIAPLLAWSRFAIPSGSINAAVLANVRVQLQAHVLARDVRLGLADFLYSPDQLPQSYSDTAALTEKLAKVAVHGRELHIDPGQMATTASFLSDTRYLIGVLAAPRGGALFRWQEEDGERETALRQWRIQGGEALRPLLPGCASELLLPQSYHAGCRESDQFSRPYSLRASVAFLCTALNLTPTELITVIAPYHDRQLEEYRVGFLLKGSGEMVHGAVWPLLDGEDESSEIAGQIEAVLREIGVAELIVLDHRLPLEYCDDCGAPLYPNPEGESVHAEMPEEQQASVSRHLH